MKKLLIAITLALAIFGLSSCSTDADVASSNLSKDAENFKIPRQIVFYNGISGEYVAEVTGLCSVESEGGKLEVTCKTGEGEFIKNYLGLSDNVTWFALQTSPTAVSTSQYKVVFKPSTIIPDFEVR